MSIFDFHIDQLPLGIISGAIVVSIIFRIILVFNKNKLKINGHKSQGAVNTGGGDNIQKIDNNANQ